MPVHMQNQFIESCKVHSGVRCQREYFAPLRGHHFAVGILAVLGSTNYRKADPALVWWNGGSVDDLYAVLSIGVIGRLCLRRLGHP